MEVSNTAVPWGYLALLSVLPVAWFVARVSTRRSPAPQTAMSRLGSLDGVRGILALAVMAHHFRIAWNWRITGRWELPSEAIFSNLGPSGVIMFFMITGLLFWRKLVVENGRLDLVPFALSRVFRIYPAYLLSLVVIALASVLTASKVAPLEVADAARSLGNWLLFAGDPHVGFQGFGDARVINAGVIWTLQYEWVFYLLLPLVALALRVTRPGAPARICLLAASIAYIGFRTIPPLGWFQTHIAVGFLYGGLAYEVLRSERICRWLQTPAASLLGLICSAGMLSSVAYPFGALNYLLLSVPFIVIAAGNSMFGVLRSREAIALGDASYSIYLFHGIFVFIFFALIPPAYLSSAVVWFGLPLIAAGVSVWSLVCFANLEEPAIRFGKALAGRRRRPTVTEEVAP